MPIPYPIRKAILAASTTPLLAASILMLFGGCAPWVTYPPIEGAAQVGHPRLEPVPSIMAEAIRFSNERFANMEEIVFNLPEGTPVSAYNSVLLRLGKGRPMTERDVDAIHIKEVRIRALDAEVDVVYPRRDGHHELVTLYMRQRMLHHYDVKSTRLWRIHVEAPPAHYPRMLQDSPAEDAPGAMNDEGGLG